MFHVAEAFTLEELELLDGELLPARETPQVAVAQSASASSVFGDAIAANIIVVY